jgi:tRNA 5-methylaminomethyl-2-thiouridine biosynthesis bifunctional protein
MNGTDDSPLVWGDDGQPRSRLYGDVYFSTSDGLAETRAVFLQGANLPQAWRGRRRFTVAELGFGSGLNIAALLDLWRRERPAAGRLQVFTVEAHPLSAAEAARTLASWPELADVAALMVARWPGAARGVHRIDLPEFHAVVDVVIGEVGQALGDWSGRADAWFLDGFSPALNPAMWRPQVLDLVGARSAPGARAATFTVAGDVRRGLAAAGFTVSKQPGFGRKRERLEAIFPGTCAVEDAPPRVAVIGAGIAGAATARALRVLGVEPLVIDARAPGAGASGAAAALVTPRLDAGLGDGAELAARAFARAVGLYGEIDGAVTARGVDRPFRQPRDAERFAKIAASDLFERGDFVVADALVMTTAVAIVPSRILAAWLGAATTASVAALAATATGWRLQDAAGAAIAEVDAVIVAAGIDSGQLAAGLSLNPVRGQLSVARGQAGEAVEWGGYMAPSPEGLVFGATHDRGDLGLDVRSGDHARNLAALAEVRPALAAALAKTDLQGRVAIRAATPDHMPLAGEIAPGLFVLTGLGGRGFGFAPLLAEHVAALVAGAASPLPARLRRLVDPRRFADRS